LHDTVWKVVERDGVQQASGTIVPDFVAICLCTSAC